MLVFRDKCGTHVRTKWLVQFVLLVAACLAFSISTAAHPTPPGTPLSGGGESGNMFALGGYSVEGEFLIISYTIRYPGMTKVKLFNQTKQLLWRSQYVNDEEGEHKLVLRKNILDSGNYTFEFRYKNERKTVNISL